MEYFTTQNSKNYVKFLCSYLCVYMIANFAKSFYNNMLAKHPFWHNTCPYIGVPKTKNQQASLGEGNK
mgnify:CR=1 FL=1